MSAKKASPPPLSLSIIRRLCREDLLEEIEGNLYEFYICNNNTKNIFSPLVYWYEVVKYLRPGTLKSFTQSKKGSMFIFNPLLTVRNLARQGSTTVINLSGFAIGLVCVFFLYFYIRSETGADKFHENLDEIYRAIRLSDINGTPYQVGVTSGPYGPALLTDFPDAIQEMNRVMRNEHLVSVADKRFVEEHVIATDANFFTFFSFPLQEGLPSEVLRQHNSIVLSAESAKKYFGNENPIGKTLILDQKSSYTVTGVMAELPGKSHLRFNMVIPIAKYENEEFFKNWWANGMITYVRIATPEIAANVISQLPQFIDKYFREDFQRIGARIDMTLEPLSDIYFNNETRYDPSQHGDLKTIYILAMVGIGILFIACFNYINLSIAQSFRRAKEVGIRKVLGGDRYRLVLQFLGESGFLILVAISISVLAIALLLPWLNTLFGLEVVYRWSDATVYLFLAGLALALLLLPGIYPAMLLSSFRPVSVLKGRSKSGTGSLALRKGLVIGQFVISICMISLTFLVARQIDFISGKELGFDKEAVLLLDNSPELRTHKESFVKELDAQPAVEAVTYTSGEPGGFHDATILEIEGREENLRMRIGFADEQYLTVFGLKLIAGRDFSKDFKSAEEKGIILNEKALEDLGMSAEEALGKLVDLPMYLGEKRRITGIVSDYHFSSLKDQIEPLVLVNHERNRRIAVKLRAGSVREGIDAVVRSYEKFSPGYPIVFTFLDDRLSEQYASEKRQSRVFSAFALVSVFLAALGILGLASYTAQQRQKEFGIRKVLGASGAGILGLISKEYMLLIGAAFVVAVPLSWYFIDGWLDSFAYRITLSDNLHLFVLSGLLTGAIAIVTITLKTYKAAVSNPIESIRYE